MSTIAWIVLGVQIATFLVLGAYYITTGNVHLGIAQLLLAAVQAVVYS